MSGEVMTLKNKYLAVVATSIIGILLSSTICTNGYADDTQIQLNNDVYTWSETVNLTVNKENDTGMHISYNTLASSENYNYATISSMFDGAYGETPIFSSSYGAIEVSVKTGNSPIYINVSLTDIDNNRLVLKNESSSLLEIGTDHEIKQTAFKSVELSDHLNGKIIIPLTMFEDDSNNKQAFDYSKLTSWTIGLLVEGKQSSELDITNLAWKENDFVNQYASSFNSYIEGSDSVQIPEHGESIADYTIHSGENNSYEFVCDEFANGISLNKSGRITLTTDAKEQTVMLKAKDKNGVSLHKEIKLVHSWRVDKKDFSFYGPEDLEKITYAFDYVEDKHINYIRITILAGCGLVFLSYIIFYTIYKRKKNEEEE